MKKVIGFLVVLLILGGIYLGLKDIGIGTLMKNFKHENKNVISNMMEQLIVTEETIKKPRGEYELIEVNEEQAFLYGFLTSEQKTVYKQLLTGIEKYEERIGIDPISDADIGKCLESLLGDHPEFFWLTGDSTIWMNKGETRKEIELAFNIDKETIDETKRLLEVKADEIIGGFAKDTSDYDKIKHIYETIILNTDYQLDCEQNQNIQSVLLYQKSVCAGYAKAFQYLVHRAGLFCGYITGKVIESGEEHAWNLVSLEDGYYYVDATWGDPAYDQLDKQENQEQQVKQEQEEQQNPDGNKSISYDYLCITSEELLRTHTANLGEKLPVCNSHAFDYYKLNYLYTDIYQPEQVVEFLKQSILNEQKETSIKFSNQAEFEAAKLDLFEKEGIKPAALIKMEREHLEEYQYTYWSNDHYYIIKIIW